ncbi:MAG: hypothetical protein O2955_02595 [Planctomycetota bacterium]|nr:hypothetical protein [Planctomycetota bacterium]MDA1211374.1 hypothetical protein [Planctomycetota bacterium]
MMSSRKLMTAAFVVFGVSVLAQSASAADPTGTWKWSMTFNNQTRERSVTLKLDGDKLTGTMPGRNNSTRDIENATFNDGEVYFETSRERNGQKFVVKYKAKIEGETLKGTIESPGRDGNVRTREWEAKKAS